MTLSGVIKHMKELEKAGLVRHESGLFAKKPDARKTIYFLEGRERIERLLERLENDVLKSLRAGAIYNETANFARKVQRIGHIVNKNDRKRLEHLIVQCESEEIYKYLTEDEKKKLQLWKMMMSII